MGFNSGFKGLKVMTVIHSIMGEVRLGQLMKRNLTPRGGDITGMWQVLQPCKDPSMYSFSYVRERSV
jgi:hypothetical protein